MRKIAYDSALAGWKEYLHKYNHGRPVVLIGHSQGTYVLRQLIAEQIDPKPALRKRLVSAILLGGNVLVKKGKDSGGDFKHIPACHSQTQLRCVVAFSTFNEPVPRRRALRPHDRQPDDPTLKVLCAYPGSTTLKTIIPTQPFAPGTTIGLAIPLIGFPTPTASTPWAEYDQAYRGACSSADGANVLQLTDQPAPRT